MLKYVFSNEDVVHSTHEHTRAHTYIHTRITQRSPSVRSPYCSLAAKSFRFRRGTYLESVYGAKFRGESHFFLG